MFPDTTGLKDQNWGNSPFQDPYNSSLQVVNEFRRAAGKKFD